MSTTFVLDCLKYVSVFSGYIFDVAKFLCDDVTLRAKLFVYKTKNLLSFVLICSIRRVKCTKRMSLLNLVLPRTFLIVSTLSGREQIICLVINAVTADVMFSQVLSIVKKRMET